MGTWSARQVKVPAPATSEWAWASGESSSQWPDSQNSSTIRSLRVSGGRRIPSVQRCAGSPTMVKVAGDVRCGGRDGHRRRGLVHEADPPVRHEPAQPCAPLRVVGWGDVELGPHGGRGPLVKRARVGAPVQRVEQAQVDRVEQGAPRPEPLDREPAVAHEPDEGVGRLDEGVGAERLEGGPRGRGPVVAGVAYQSEEVGELEFDRL